MKKILLSLGITAFVLFSHAQRSLDLHLTLLSPQNGSTIPPQQPYNIAVSVTNTDPSEDLETTDLVYFYVIMMGDTMTILPENEDHWKYSGNHLEPTQSFNISRTFAFSDQFDGMDVDICIYIKPVNDSVPVEDPNQTNNSECTTVHVSSGSLSFGEWNAGSVQLTPNPANTQFSLSGLPENAVITISDLSGNNLSVASVSGNTVDCSSWPDGVYLVRVATPDTNLVRRMVVSH
ncbi:T9SS type A sorting domain-containing protein [Fluviicola sp.]|uniref:T9SS type A sorting domain-containing protein n=1 Tax=Fluviicola sp. TaxID=1917219 RepID=UPI0031D8F955